MKVYVATRFTDSQHDVERLCKAVRHAGLKDFSFVRDVEHYKSFEGSAKQLWEKVRDEIGACDALLIDVSDHPTGGRVVEAGIAYAMGKTVIVVKKHGVQHKAYFDGIARGIITYENDEDLTKQLKHFDKDQSFNTTDKTMLLFVFLLGGGFLSYLLAQLWIPLAGVGAIVYWLVVRILVEPLRAFDRVVIYIPLVILWAGVYFWLNTFNITLALAWAIVFWIVMLPLLQRAKLSL